MHIYSGTIGVNNNNVTKLMGLCMGLEYAQAQRFSKIAVEGDSQIIVNIARKLHNGHHIHKVSSSWRLESLLEQVSSFIYEIQALFFGHVRRTCDKIVDFLENYGCLETFDQIASKWDLLLDSPLKRTCWNLVHEDYITLDGVM